jgi:two-component system, OmpR family, sensor kinase
MLSIIGTRLFSDYIITQRIDEQQKKLNSLSVSLAPYLFEYDSEYINNVLIENTRQEGGRFLVLNQNGVVLLDSFSMIAGRRLQKPEVYDILYGESDFSYGFHRIESEKGSKIWSANYTSAIVSEYDTIGILLYSQDIQDLVDKSNNITKTFTSITILTSLITVFISLFLSGYITKPIIELRDFATKISKGELHQRIHIEGNNEISSLGETFNVMSERIENMDNAKNDFVSNASHELKTPLSSMKILAQSLLYQQDASTEIYRDFLGDIDLEMDRLNDIISDLLFLTKIEDEQSALNISEIQLTDYIKKIVHSVKPIADQKNIALSLEIKEDIIIKGDELKLRIAISNLVENSIKYTDNGGTVDVTVFSDQENICVEVKDTGVGIKQEELGKIFNRFYRVDKARARKTGGTGLGLHICKRIVNLHNGDILARSVYGQGSVFTLILPKPHSETTEA